MRSSKARRLKRIKPGDFNPPGGRPICVPGINWVTVMVLGMKRAPSIAAMRWWTTRGKFSSDKRTEEIKLLNQCVKTWGKRVLHVWDRGFCGRPWLSQASHSGVRFVMRRQKGYKLRDRHGENRKAWEITRGKRSWEHRELWDNRRRCLRKTGVYACPVTPLSMSCVNHAIRFTFEIKNYLINKRKKHQSRMRSITQQYGSEC